MGVTSSPTVEVAAFEDRETFEHFEDLLHPDCFACNSRLMLVRPIKVDRQFVLLPATKKQDDKFVVMPGRWLVYPRAHLTSLEQLPDYWTASVKHAVRILRLDEPYNTGENWGRGAGRTIKHAHTWIVDRSHGETGLLSEDLGLATIVDRIKDDHVPKI